MPPIRFLVFKHYAYIIAIILLFSEIMPSYSRCEEKKLVYIIITALFNYQSSSCIKCTKLNMYLSCNIKSVSNTKYLYFIYPYSL